MCKTNSKTNNATDEQKLPKITGKEAARYAKEENFTASDHFGGRSIKGVVFISEYVRLLKSNWKIIESLRRIPKYIQETSNYL